MNPDESEIMEQVEWQFTELPEASRSPLVNIMPLAEEEELVQQVKQGSSDAILKLCDYYLDQIYCYFYRRVKDISAAEALTSRTFHQAKESICHDKWHGPFFGAWLFLIAHTVFDEWLQENNKVLGAPLSTSAKYTEPIEECASVLDALLRKKKEDALWQLVKDLSLAQQRVVIMRHAYDLPYAEIAKRLACDEDACKHLHYQALTDLKRKIHASGLWSEIAGG